jgi:hypothetical protein
MQAHRVVLRVEGCRGLAFRPLQAVPVWLKRQAMYGRGPNTDRVWFSGARDVKRVAITLIPIAGSAIRISAGQNEGDGVAIVSMLCDGSGWFVKPFCHDEMH